MAGRTRRAAAAVHRGRRLAAAADLGDGHRQPGPHRRRLPRGVPDQPGRQQAADARRRAGPADVRGHRPRARGHGPPPVHRRRRAPVDGVARRVRGRQQRRLRRPVRRQGQRRGAGRATPRGTRATCCSARPTARSSKAPRTPGIVSFDRARGAPLVDLNLDGLLDLVVVNRVEPVTRVAQRRRGRRRRAGRDGRLDRGPAAPAGAQRRRHRRVGRGAGRRPHARARGHGRRRPRRRAARLDPLRPRRRRRGRGPGPVARRRGRAVDDGRRRRVRDRSSGDRGDPWTRRKRATCPPTVAESPAGLRDAAQRAAAPGVDLRRAAGTPSGARWRHAATTASSCRPTGSTAPTSPTSPGSTRGSRRRC